MVPSAEKHGKTGQDEHQREPQISPGHGAFWRQKCEGGHGALYLLSFGSFRGRFEHSPVARDWFVLSAGSSDAESLASQASHGERGLGSCPVPPQKMAFRSLNVGCHVALVLSGGLFRVFWARSAPVVKFEPRQKPQKLYSITAANTKDDPWAGLICRAEAGIYGERERVRVRRKESTG